MTKQETSSSSREIQLNPSRSELAEKGGFTVESVAMVDAEIRDGKLFVTVAGEPNLQETTHRLPPKLQQPLDKGGDGG